jgi:serine/threonine protein kinase
MGSRTDWQQVSPEPLGAGGQSTVFLVRRPERVAARDGSFKILRDLSEQGFSNQTALEFSRAAFDVARKDYPSELGAVKIFRPRAGGPDTEKQAFGRIQNEIAVLKENRPGLLKLLDCNESENWIVTEYCSRGRLDRHLSRYKGNATLALTSFSSLVRAVSELHKEPYVHRDIKPQNIFVGDADELFLGDFGIVFLPNLPERLSFTGESVGPRDFMPPWVFLDEHPEINPTFDVYMPYQAFSQ